MEFTEMLKMLSGPLIGAVIGYFTNMIAVKMLFYPKKEIRLFGRRLPLTPGVIPKGRSRLANAIGEVIETHLLTKEDVTKHLLSGQAEKSVTDAIIGRLSGNIREEVISITDMDDDSYETKKAALVRKISCKAVQAIQSSDASQIILDAFSDALREKYSSTPLKLLVNDKTLSKVIPPAKDILDRTIDEHGADYIYQFLDERLVETEGLTGMELLAKFDLDEQAVRKAVAMTFRKIVSQSVDIILQSVNISALVEEKINAMSIDELEQLVQDVMKKELNAIINLGALIGFILGLLNLFI